MLILFLHNINQFTLREGGELEHNLLTLLLLFKPNLYASRSHFEPVVIFCVYQEIQKLVAFLVVFLGAYLCQILKEINLISLVSFAFLVHVMIQKLQDLDSLGSRN